MSSEKLPERHKCRQTALMTSEHSHMKGKDEQKLERTVSRKIYARKWVGGAVIRAAKGAVVKLAAAE